MKFVSYLLALAVLSAGPLAAQSIVGSWLATKAGESNGDAVLTFLPNGTYLMAEDGDRNLDPSGKDGMERGTYTWNPRTNAFSNKTLVDTSGEWGLSDESVKSVSVSGNTLEFAGVKLKKVISPKSKLVGSWYIENSDGYAVITFLANGEYFMVQDGKSEGGGRTGMERGTFTWNPSTKVLKRKILVDTNGEWGLYDGKITISTSGRQISLKIPGESIYKLKRVAN